MWQTMIWDKMAFWIALTSKRKSVRAIRPLSVRTNAESRPAPKPRNPESLSDEIYLICLCLLHTDTWKTGFFRYPMGAVEWQVWFHYTLISRQCIPIRLWNNFRSFMAVLRLSRSKTYKFTRKRSIHRKSCFCLICLVFWAGPTALHFWTEALATLACKYERPPLLRLYGQVAFEDCSFMNCSGVLQTLAPQKTLENPIEFHNSLLSS